MPGQPGAASGLVGVQLLWMCAHMVEQAAYMAALGRAAHTTSSHNLAFRSLRNPVLPGGLCQDKQQSAKRLAAPLGPHYNPGAPALHNAL